MEFPNFDQNTFPKFIHKTNYRPFPNYIRPDNCNQCKSNNIHIPQFDRPVYEAIARKHYGTYLQYLGDFLKNYKGKESVSCAFFDYCVTLVGNTYIKPVEDIKTYFGKKIPMHDSIFAVTVSVRAKTGSMGEIFSKTAYYVTRYAAENGYKAVCLPCGFGYNGMYVVFFRIL